MLKKIEIDVNNTGHITNLYVIWDENKNAIIVDPADKFEEIDKIVIENRLIPRYVFLTHAHGDHTLALKDTLDRYNIKVVIHKFEKDMITGNIQNYSLKFGKEQIPIDENNVRFVNDGEDIVVGDMIWKAIATPGHTKGCTCYANEKENIILTGDTLFEDCFGRCDLVTSSVEDMKNSLFRLYSEYGEYTIYPGHGNTAILKNTLGVVKRIFKKYNIDFNYGGENE